MDNSKVVSDELLKEFNELKDLNRDIVIADYNSSKKKNKELFIKGDVRASSQYIFNNQKKDAAKICDKFYNTDTKCISIVKRTKVGMDGLMIEIAKNITTHKDNNVALDRDNVLFITGMSNKSWEDDMRDKLPSCFKENVYHHGKLQRLQNRLRNIKNSLIIIDEIDTGDKEDQKLHLLLKESGILDIKYMEENNIRFVFVSATMINELHYLYHWGDKHYIYYMTIPDNYIGHKEFLKLNIIQEFYPINDVESADKWIKEDILEHYGDDYRVHIIRTDEKNKDFILNACIKNKIHFKNHTSDDRISNEELSTIFDNINNHLVIAVKGFYRRANLIPNKWKLKIGATHERYVKKYDTNVQVQGFPGRVSGYWKNLILNGHKTGPHRTSIAAINEYEEFYKNPLGKIKYNTAGSKKSFLNPKNIKNLETINKSEEAIVVDENKKQKTNGGGVIKKDKNVIKDRYGVKDRYRVYDDEKITKEVCTILGYGYRKVKNNSDGFKKTSVNYKAEVVSLKQAISKVPSAYTNHGDKITWRTCYPCYVDVKNKDTLRFVVIIRPETDISKVETEIDTIYPSMKL